MDAYTILRMLWLNADNTCKCLAGECTCHQSEDTMLRRRYILADLRRDTIRDIADAFGMPEVYADANEVHCIV